VLKIFLELHIHFVLIVPAILNRYQVILTAEEEAKYQHKKSAFKYYVSNFLNSHSELFRRSSLKTTSYREQQQNLVHLFSEKARPSVNKLMMDAIKQHNAYSNWIRQGRKKLSTRDSIVTYTTYMRALELVYNFRLIMMNLRSILATLEGEELPLEARLFLTFLATYKEKLKTYELVEIDAGSKEEEDLIKLLLAWFGEAIPIFINMPLAAGWVEKIEINITALSGLTLGLARVLQNRLTASGTQALIDEGLKEEQKAKLIEVLREKGIFKNFPL